MTEATNTPDTGAEPVAQSAHTQSVEPVADDRSDIPGEVAPRSVSDIVADVLKDLPDEWDTDVPSRTERDEGGRFKGKDAEKVPEKAAEAPTKTEAKTEEGEPEPETTVTPEDAPKAVVPPPARFNEAAKAAWDKADDALRHEVVRMEREVLKGYEEAKARLAEVEARDEPLRPYRAMAEQAGVKVEDALYNYVAAEQALHENPVHALARLAQIYVPGGLDAFVTHLTGQPQGQTTPEAAVLAEIKADNVRLRSEIERLSQGVTQTFAAQRQAQAAAEQMAVVQQFQAANPRAAQPEVQAEMTRLLTTGYISHDLPAQERLSQAYAAATRLIPAPAEPAPPPEPDQTRAQAISVTGAPTGGSNPRHRTPAANPQEAVSRAFAQLGLD